jgi:hypothetical protein
MIIKPLAAQVALTTTSPGSDIGAANLVRILNNSATAGLVTIQNSGATVATLTVAGNQEIVIEKEPSYTIFGSAATLLAVKIAYAN